MAQQYTYGIDFGTCNSVIEVFDHGQNAVLDVAGHFENALESSIYFPQGETTGYSLGNEALQNYLGTDLKGRFIKSLKSALSAPFLNEITIHGKRFELVKLVSFFLSELKQRADSHLGANVDRVILGRPARFSADPMEDQVAEQRLVKAARQAGFRDIRLLQEPIAAAVAFQAFSNTDEQILIGDIGAGTSDFALIQSEKALANLFDKHAIQTAGVKRGGDDFDAQVMWEHIVAHFGYGSEYESYQRLLPIPSHIFWNLCYWEKLSLVNKKDLLKSLQKFHHTTPDKAKIGRLIHLMEENLGFQLLKRVEKAKQHLSSAHETQIQFEAGAISLDESLTSTDFSGCITPPLGEIADALDGLMDVGVAVDAVCLTGGSTLLPAVRGVFEDRFGEERIREGDAFRSVAKGLAGAGLYWN